MRQDFLRQHGQRHRADMAARLGALDHQRVGARADQPLGQHQRRGEAISLAPPSFTARTAPPGGMPPASTMWPTLASQADPDQVVELRVHGDQVDAERPVGQRLGAGDLGREQVRVHRAAGDHAEAAGVGDRRDQVALADPAHRAAHDGDVGSRGTRCRAPTAGRASPPRTPAAGIGRGDVRRHRGHRRCAARAPRVRCIRRRSAR